MASPSPRHLLRAFGLAALAVAPIVAQHFLLRSTVGEVRRARVETAARAGADLLEERVSRSFARWKATVSNVAASEDVRRAAFEDPLSKGDEHAQVRRRAASALSEAASALGAGVVARLVHPDGRVIASSAGAAEEGARPALPEGFTGSLRSDESVLEWRSAGADATLDFIVPVRAAGRGPRSVVWLRLPASQLDELARDVAAGLDPRSRVVGVDARGECWLDSEGARLGRVVEPATPEALAEWERSRVFGAQTAALLRELAAAPRLTGFLGPDLGPTLVERRRSATAQLDLACFMPIETGVPLLGSAGLIAFALSLLAGGAAFGLALGGFRLGDATIAPSMRLPMLAGAGVLAVSAGITLYATRAIDDRGREVRRSFAQVVDRMLESDLDTFVRSRLAIFLDRDDALAASVAPESEFLEFARDAAAGPLRGGRMSLSIGDLGAPSARPIVVPPGEPLDVTPRATLPPSSDTLERPMVYVDGHPERGDARLVFEAPFRSRSREGRLFWVIPLHEVFAQVLASDRTGAFSVRVAAELPGHPSVFPPGALPQPEEIPLEPFRFPRDGGVPIHLVLGPRPSMDLFGAETSKTVVLGFGMLLAFGAAVGTTLVLGSLASYRHSSRIDALTGLHNRLDFGVMLDRERQRALRYERPLSVALVDLDNFKRVNDTLGHAAGDEALRSVARELESAVRGTDFVFRHGGEEFAILLPETDAEAARLVLERVRERFARGPLSGAERAGVVTLSSGLATLEAEESSDSILVRADTALYEAKHRGRNRVVGATTRAARIGTV